VTTDRSASELVLRQVVVGPLQTNCWIMHTTASSTALLVDPGDDADAILVAVSSEAR